MTFSAGKGIGIVMAVSVFAIIAAFVMPVGIGNIADNEQLNVTQSVNERVDLNAQLTANTTDIVGGTTNEVTVKLNDTKNQTTKSVVVGEGTTKQVAFEGENINITVHSIDTTTAPNSSDMQYGTPHTYGWSDGATSLYTILDLIIVLALMLTGLGWAMKIFN